MKEIFVVSNDESSGRAYFTTREKAEKYVERMKTTVYKNYFVVWSIKTVDVDR